MPTAPVLSGARVSLTDNALYNAFPAAVQLSGGNGYLIAYRVDTTHIGNGSKIVGKKASTIAGLAAATEFTIVAANAYDQRDSGLCVIQEGSHAGRIVLTYYEYYGTNSTSKVVYTDDPTGLTGWTSPATIDFGFTYGGIVNGAICAPAVELPGTGGHLLVAGYGLNIGQDVNYAWSKVAKSTDGGASWAALSTLAPYSFGSDNVEPNLAVGTDGSGNPIVIATTRSDGANLLRLATSSNGAATFTTPTTFATNGNGRPAIIQLPDGGWVSMQRNTAGLKTALLYSSNKGATWSTTGFDSSGNFHVYGQWIVVGGELWLIYAVENSTTDANIYAQKWTITPNAEGYGNTVSAGYGDGTAYALPIQGLTIDPASNAWEQIDTQIIVRVTADPSTVDATVSSRDGGLVRFAGTDADRFEISLDGTAWATTLDVPAGETDVKLRVTPDSPGTTLTAQIGVPV